MFFVKAALFTILAGFLFCAPQAQEQQPVPRRLIYAVPEYLPQNYSWQFRNEAFTDVVWVGYRFDNHGKLTYNNAAKLTPLLRNNPRKQYLLAGLKDIASGIKLLSDPAAAEASRQSVQKLLARHPEITGLQFDFEYLPPRLANNYTLYIQQMRNFIHRRITLQVAVFPPADFPEHLKGFHDLPGLLQASDGLVVMLYDRHRPGTEPGCVTPISWLNRNLAALSELPPEKVWLGAPLYGYKFSAKKTAAIDRKAFFSNYTPYKPSPQTQNTPSPNYTAYSSMDGCLMKELPDRSQLWYPDESLYSVYYMAYKDRGFAGLAFWRAGWEY